MLKLVRGTPTAGVLVHWVIIPDGGSEIRCIIGSIPSIQIPHVQKVLWFSQFSGRIVKFQAPKTPRTDTILPKHLLAHTLIIYVYSHYCIWSFCHHFPCKNDILVTSTRAYSDRIFRPRKHASHLHKLSIYC